jgi:chemotaxis protein CheZ
MPAPRKIFRIEEMATAGSEASDEAALAALRHGEIMQELKLLSAALTARASAWQRSSDVDALEVDELQRLKSELHLIYDAINRTKRELASLHDRPRMTRVANELDAVMGGTEKATQTILAAAEDIDQAANTLSAALRGESELGLTQDIQDRVIQIFEACNFHDLTGQRITKVMATLRFIEEHVIRMIEIWGGLDTFNNVSATAADEHANGELVHGPRLEGDRGHASQGDIDLLFG